MKVVKAPKALPVLGHGPALWRDPLEFLSSLPAYGDLVEIRVGPRPVLIPCTPALVRQILLNDRTFDKGGPLIDKGRDFIGNGLATCPRDDHRRQRRLVQPSFHSSRLPAYARTMAEEISASLASWESGQTVDLLGEMKKITTRVTARVVFASGMPERDVVQVGRDFGIFTDGVFRGMLLPDWMAKLPLPAHRAYGRAYARLSGMIGQTISAYKADGSDRGDLLSALLAAREADESLSEAEIRDQIMTFLFGGIETTAILLTWALYLLGRHPEAEDRLRAEVDAQLAGHAAELKDVDKFPFVSAVLNETLRLYPPGWMVPRVATQDATLEGHFIASGTVLGVSAYVMHHRPGGVACPKSFIPDRWNRSGAPSSHEMFPFGMGARKCIGNDFAMLEATLALASVISQWRCEIAPKSRARPELKALLQPRDVRVRLVRREH
ncbi:cytochrome P450 [Streptomyces sp. NPDC001985]|uniref:cytochrome P450 n=1 Tax=Streptomyces sp. NPDC001985 TaxID=3154406 RepID=UPI00331A5B43